MEARAASRLRTLRYAAGKARFAGIEDVVELHEEILYSTVLYYVELY